MWGFCGCNHRRTEPVRDRDTREWVSVRKPCNKKEDKDKDKDCCCDKDRDKDRDRDRDRNNSVSPSSFCERQLRAAEESCIANPRSNFSGCRRTF